MLIIQANSPRSSDPIHLSGLVYPGNDPNYTTRYNCKLNESNVAMYSRNVMLANVVDAGYNLTSLL